MRDFSLSRTALAAGLIGATVFGYCAFAQTSGRPQPGVVAHASQSHPLADGAIRIATYNILNLFDAHDDPSLEGRFEDMHSSRDGLRAKPASQREAVAKAIREVNADVIGLQEIESFDALVEFREEFLADAGYEHVVSIDIGQERGIEQAVMSRYPIVEARVWPHMALGGTHPQMYGDQPNWYAGQPIFCRRSPLVVTIEVPAATRGADPYRLTLFIVHHKAGRYNDYWRERESARFVELIGGLEAERPGRNIAIIGDFNAVAVDDSMKTYRDAGLRDAFAVAGVDRGAAYTHESGRTIDFVLVNDNLAGELVPSSAFIHETPVRPLNSDYRTTPAPDGFASDHKPVCVDIIPRDG